MDETFIGEIKPFAGSYAPRGWIECDGRKLAVQQYQVLFAIIATQFGGDVTQGYFHVPDMRGRVTVGIGQGVGLSPWVVNQQAGSESVFLTTQEIPPHNHTISTDFAPYKTHAGNFTSGPTAGVSYPSRLLKPTSATKADTLNAYAKLGVTGPDTMLHPSVLGEAGGSEAHENRQPVLALRFAINAAAGIYPTFA